MNPSILHLAWRNLWRDLRAGQLRLVLVAVTLAVAALTAVGFFADRLQGALARDARQLLGGDAVLASDQPTPAAFSAEAARLGLRSSSTLGFPTMARAPEEQGGASRLVALKSVAPGYPLRGRLQVAASAEAPGQPTDTIPAPGEVWVGDIGDNGRSREKITVYRFTEPKRLPRRGRTVKVATKKYTFTYPDRPRDAEALLVHPRTGRLFIVTKSAEGDPGIYRSPKKLSRSSTNTLKRIADAPLKITAGAFSPDGKTRVLSSYTTAYTYRKFTGRPASVTLPTRRQGESLEVNRRGTEVLLGSEGEKSPVLAIAMTTPPS